MGARNINGKKKKKRLAHKKKPGDVKAQSSTTTRDQVGRQS